MKLDSLLRNSDRLLDAVAVLERCEGGPASEPAITFQIGIPIDFLDLDHRSFARVEGIEGMAWFAVKKMVAERRTAGAMVHEVFASGGTRKAFLEIRFGLCGCRDKRMRNVLNVAEDQRREIVHFVIVIVECHGRGGKGDRSGLLAALPARFKGPEQVERRVKGDAHARPQGTLGGMQVYIERYNFGACPYLNRDWAEKMLSLGLIPSDTGRPGGKMAGQKIASYPGERGSA